MARRSLAVVLPARGAPACPCGETRVLVFREGLDGLMDNMGCELGLERVGGPVCPRCDEDALGELRGRAERRSS